MSVVVVVPTYNEVESLPRLLDALAVHLPQADVLVVDDNSPDGTGVVAASLARREPGIHVLHRPAKDGLGHAYRAGFAWALARDYAIVVQMDADGSHRPQDLPALVAAAEAGTDLVIGSRWVPGGGVRNWPWYRRAISRGGTRYARRMLGLPVADATAGFRAFRRLTLERIDLEAVASQGYCFQIDMTRRVLAAGMQVVELPILFVERERGRSKMSGAIVREALWRTTLWGLQRRRTPDRIEGPS
ncbi:glycosyltransferase, group 2 family protein [Aeromicrobium marinum DSM 15272]|uniref:Glycosyltransferase, group 2 family protein n=1 Tax=Aeromicrobium marinum DSM 15272 TaxID=585531 RepID=E2S9U6_9ACTN|nr:polyprenol monophosphomannose synthase [Aeromicrobium marinum]EFQ84020.1 glycosyltransferase, group 2 family protein [Aeromicrobium marinum DSM 15272]